MDQEEAVENLQLIDAALELLEEKRKQVKQVLQSPEEKRLGICFKRVEENREQLEKFGDLKACKTLIPADILDQV